MISRTPTDLILTHVVTGETLTLVNQYNRDRAQGNAVELFQFADRTVRFTDLNPEDVDDDILAGRGGEDTYVYARGTGHDQIAPNSSGADGSRLVLQGISAEAISARITVNGLL